MIHIHSIFQAPGTDDRIVWLGKFEYLEVVFSVIADMINDGSPNTYAVCDDRDRK